MILNLAPLGWESSALTTRPMLHICNIGIYADDITLYCNFNQASNLWQQLELTSKVESDLQDSTGFV